MSKLGLVSVLLCWIAQSANAETVVFSSLPIRTCLGAYGSESSDIEVAEELNGLFCTRIDATALPSATSLTDGYLLSDVNYSLSTTLGYDLVDEDGNRDGFIGIAPEGLYVAFGSPKVYTGIFSITNFPENKRLGDIFKRVTAGGKGCANDARRLIDLNCVELPAYRLGGSFSRMPVDFVNNFQRSGDVTPVPLQGSMSFFLLALSALFLRRYAIWAK